MFLTLRHNRYVFGTCGILNMMLITQMFFMRLHGSGRWVSCGTLWIFKIHVKICFTLCYSIKDTNHTIYQSFTLSFLGILPEGVISADTPASTNDVYMGWGAYRGFIYPCIPYRSYRLLNR